jgi:hypothetical protein
MENGSDTFGEDRQIIRGDISRNELKAAMAGRLREVLRSYYVANRGSSIETSYGPAPAQEFHREMRADKTRYARNQRTFHFTFLMRESTARLRAVAIQ